MSKVRQIAWKNRLRRHLSRALRPVEAWARERLLLWVDQLVLFAPAKPDPDRVLIVRLDNIGDFVVWLDAAKALTEHYREQGKHVTLLANAVWKNWASDLGIFDEVVALEEHRFRRDPSYRYRMARLIRALRYGTAVQTSYTRMLEGGDSLMRLSGATHRLGHEGTFPQGFAKNRSIGDRWYTQLIPIDSALSGEMRTNAAFVRALTGKSYRAKVVVLQDQLSLELPHEFSALMAGQPYFVLFPGASFAGRLWPAERYVELASRIYEITGWVGLICGGRSESLQAARMWQTAKSPLFNWVERTDLTQLAAVLAHAKLLIGNETSAVHIAAGVGTPSVCILGGGHYGRFVPYDVEVSDGRPLPVAAVHEMNCFHCDWRCIYHPPKGAPFPCIDEISVDTVLKAVERSVGGIRTSARSLTHIGQHLCEFSSAQS